MGPAILGRGAKIQPGLLCDAMCFSSASSLEDEQVGHVMFVKGQSQNEDGMIFLAVGRKYGRFGNGVMAILRRWWGC